MTTPKGSKAISRRAALGTMAMAGAGTLGAAPAALAADQSLGGEPAGETVRDRFWIFTVAAGLNDWHMEKGGVRGGSRMTPAEGAFWLDVPNLLFIRAFSVPTEPRLESEWKAKSTYEQYAISFQPLHRVVWSIVGSGGEGGMKQLPDVLSLADEYPNFTGVFLDDFFPGSEKREDGTILGRPAIGVAELDELRAQMRARPRPLELWLTLYTHQLGRGRYRTDPPLPEILERMDVVTLWTWDSNKIRDLEDNLAFLEKIKPEKPRIALGLYIWDFHNKKPVPVEAMKMQCELGLKWLREGRISDMIFLANTVLDVGLPSAEFARKWIAEVGSQPLP